MLKPFVSKFRPDLSVTLKDIADKQVLAKLKLLEGFLEPNCIPFNGEFLDPSLHMS